MRIAIAGSTGLVGRQVVAAAAEAGHEIVELAREKGVDLRRADGLADRLASVEAVVDVTQGPLDEPEASAFFTTVARNLGEAATAAGVTRTVTLSIIGVDQMPDYGYYVAKLAQEETARAHAPEPHVLRAAQFLDFPGQMLTWFRQGDTVTVPAMRTQPVAVDQIVRQLLALADGSETRGLVELAGPTSEDLAVRSPRTAASRSRSRPACSARRWPTVRACRAPTRSSPVLTSRPGWPPSPDAYRLSPGAR
jgi:uncharacterized protein YbjT (DUF2867 family)